LFRVVQVRGDDAASFLQGQLTQDMGRVGESGVLLAAWCNPQGRVICVLRTLSLDGGFGLVLPAELAEPVVRRMLLYRLRAKAEIAIADDLQAVAVAAGPDLEALATRELLPDEARGACRRARDVTAFELGGPARCVELYGPRTAIAALTLTAPLTDSDWQKALIAAGIPTITTATTEQYTPHMLNLDRLGAVSFDKGCYTGQEIVARTEYRGQTKRRLLHYRLEHGEANVGDRLMHQDREVGEVLNTAGPDLLAVAPTELQEQPLTVNGQQASPVPLPYSA
jgi:tRNA-modifying protein YgfZ